MLVFDLKFLDDLHLFNLFVLKYPFRYTRYMFATLGDMAVASYIFRIFRF